MQSNREGNDHTSFARRLPEQFTFLFLLILVREMIKLHIQQNLINLPVVTLSDPPIRNSLIDRIDSILS